MEFLYQFFLKGEILSLTAAVIWAVAVILFRVSGRSVHPLGLNFFKSTLACLLLMGTILISGQSLFPNLSWQNYTMLFFSGIVGIGISDTLLFASLNRLGASLYAIVNTSYSPFVIFLAAIFLNENMNTFQLIGVCFIIAAVLAIVYEKQRISLPRKVLISGIALGIAAMFTMAVSIILMKPYLNESTILHATFIRTLGGVVFTWGLISFHPDRQAIYSEAFSRSNWKPMIPGSFLGSYLSLLAWMGGMKLIQTSEASALNQLNIIFIFIFGVIFLKESVTLRKVSALMLAALGVLLVTLF